ncbi:glycine-tRNA synthetase subunit beta [Buchnera aphidicola (Aphis glycines)]|uniref:Glycine--tRNA ligase beta subunit n=1 Tax=Buchnera aphidicola (Aphis glycines) TaxID=1265350 RepID=A0A0M4HDX4_9GAMM|nr:glycine--tRNA ligase subunit beta [Buchnera aphidicola]ALD15098.1 glycine-tRNA synthetase subunit beta [Buchnera aphidicola (Aphis glycines)]
MKKTFLVEIGTEELPARILYNVITIFYENFIHALHLNNIEYKKIYYFATPRRLALKILDIDSSQKIKKILKKGPSLKNSFDKDGMPTKSACSWANHMGIKIHEAHQFTNKKGAWLAYHVEQKQEKIEILLPQITEMSLTTINIKNLMRWEENNIKFFRPIRNIVMMLDDEIINKKIFNIDSKNKVHHHISFKEKKIYLNHAQEYPSVLLKHSNIIADYNIRKEQIKKNIKEIAKQVNGYTQINLNLLEEINSIVESPKGMLANFKKKYITCIPNEILVYIIEQQQKCFPIYNKTKLLPYFIVITNIHSKKENQIIFGNETVMEARLSDVMFFLKKDRKIKLLDYLPLLKKVLFYKDLGTLYDKTIRLQSLVNFISNSNNKIDLIKSAVLSKCDLITEMVCEFPELQGVIGMHYAIQDQEKYEIALAIKEQYLPAFSEDILPSSLMGSILSISDKIDTLCGMFLINQIPLSNKDPFALRRAAVGIIRIIIDTNMSLDLESLVYNSIKIYNKKELDYILTTKKIINFFKLRLLSFYQKQGYNIKVIQSVLSFQITDIVDIDKRIKAISNLKKEKKLKSILLIIKRISNILTVYKKDISNIKINTNLIQIEEEKNLFKEINSFNNDTKKLFMEKNYKIILSKLKNFEKPVNNFFDQVKINHCNIEIKNNRLILLKKIKNIFFKIAKFSYLY